MPGSGKGGGTVEDVLIQFLGTDSLTNVGKTVEKSLQNVQKQADNTAKSLGNLDKQTQNLGKSMQNAGGSSGMGGFNRNMEQGVSRLEQMSNSMQKLQWMFMDFGLIMAGMTAQSMWDKFMAPAIKLEDAKSTLVFMGESAEAVDRMNASVTTYAANASKVSMPEIMGAWQMVRLQSKVSADQMERLTPILGDTVAQFKANGRTAESASMAIADGIAGQFKRMQEIGIKQEDLKATGLWKGTTEDVEGFMNALAKIYSDRGLTGIAQKTVSTADYLNIVSEKLEMAFMKIGEEILPYVKTFLEWFVGALESGAGPILAWTTLIAGLGMIFIFIAPFILSVILLLSEFGATEVVVAGETILLDGRLTALAFKMKLVQINSAGGVAGLTRFGAAMVALGVAIMGVVVAWEIYNYMDSKRKEIVEYQTKVIKDNEQALIDTRSRYEELQKQMNEGVTRVYDEEKKAWVDIKTAVAEAGDEYTKTATKSADAYTKIIGANAQQESIAKTFALGSPIPRDTTLGNFIELEGAPGMNMLFGGDTGWSQNDRLRYSSAASVLETEKYALSEEGKGKFKKKGESDSAYENRQKKITNDFLKEKLKLTDKDVTSLRKARNATIQYEEASGKLKFAIQSLINVIVALFLAIMGDEEGSKKALDDSKKPTDDWASSLDNLTTFIGNVTTFVTNLTNAISTLVGWIGTVIGWIGQFKQAWDNLPQAARDALGMDTVQSPSNSTSTTTVTTQTTPAGPDYGQVVKDNKNKQIVPRIGGNSPLALKNLSGEPMLHFPQFTPEFVKGVESFRKNKNQLTSQSSVIHHHNERITLDTRHMGEKQLTAMLTNIYEGIIQRRNISPAPRNEVAV